MQYLNTIINSDVIDGLKLLPDKCVQTVVTSPPYYGLRRYGNLEGQIGHEDTPEEYIQKLVNVFEEVKRVLDDSGIFWINIGDSFNSTSGYSRYKEGWMRENRKDGSDTKKAFKHSVIKVTDQCLIPFRLAIALQENGWYFRSDIIWSKNGMPELVRSRPTRSHEYIFMLTKKPKYYFDAEAIKEDCVTSDGTKYKRSVWSVPVQSFGKNHIAAFPVALIEPCILAGSKEGDIILDPFMGSGTVAVASIKNRRNYIGIELNSKYIEFAEKRIKNAGVNLF